MLSTQIGGRIEALLQLLPTTNIYTGSKHQQLLRRRLAKPEGSSLHEPRTRWCACARAVLVCREQMMPTKLLHTQRWEIFLVFLILIPSWKMTHKFQDVQSIQSLARRTSLCTQAKPFLYIRGVSGWRKRLAPIFSLKATL